MIVPADEFNNGDVRLVSSFMSPVTMGVIEVFGLSKFGTVCSDMFNNVAASVVCRQLGSRDGG